jgi:predicted anti-sigma-YlaC factor YlaD
MRCEETQDLLPAYIDRELDMLKNAALENHFTTCQSCSGQRADQLNLRWTIRAGAQYFTAPDHLKRRIRKQISEV